MYSKTFHTYEYAENGNVLDELATQVEISIYDYIMKTNPSERMHDADTMKIKLLFTTTDYIKYNVSINKLALSKKLDLVKLNEYMNNYIKYNLNEIIPASDGYYLIEYADIDDQVSLPSILTFNVTLRYQYFEIVQDMFNYIDILDNNQVKNNCVDLYNDYKKSCEDTWDIQKDQSVSNEKAIEIIYKLEKCIYKRQYQYNRCKNFQTVGHQGAIKRLTDIKDFYKEELVRRLTKSDYFGKWE